MSSHLDSSHTGCDSGVSRLRQQVRDREIEQRLQRRLPGHALPDFELGSLHATSVPLRSHVAGWVAVEFFPGEGKPPVADDGHEAMAVMRARPEHTASFDELARANARTLSVVSAPPEAIDLTKAFIDPRGLMFCDPKLLIADALALPTVQNGETRHYRRLTLLARDARIERVIFPPDEDFPRHAQRIVSLVRASGR
jgi:peroxiredoxin